MITAKNSGLISCDFCQLVCRAPRKAISGEYQLRCPCCNALLYSRINNSLVKTWALLIAAIILYIPANLLPIMSYITLGQSSSETIMQGVISFIEYDMWPIAMIVFVASIIVPILKFLVMIMLLLTVQFKSNWRPYERVQLYHIVSFIGRWSMVDIFVVSLVVMLVQFGNLATISVGSGSLSFALVVILTMIASHTFDPRLIWDDQPLTYLPKKRSS